MHVGATPGLQEKKKAEMRRQLTSTARRLALRDGLGAVTVQQACLQVASPCERSSTTPAGSPPAIWTDCAACRGPCASPAPRPRSRPSRRERSRACGRTPVHEDSGGPPTAPPTPPDRRPPPAAPGQHLPWSAAYT